MKKCKFIYKFKKILISIMCIITLFLAMPVKASAGPIESLADMVLWIFDLPMRALNAVVAESDSASYIDVNLKGIGLGTMGMLYNFEVTPDRIFSAGKTEEVFVPVSNNGGSIISVADSKTGIAGVYKWNISTAISQQSDPIYTVKVGSTEHEELLKLVNPYSGNIKKEDLIEYLNKKKENGEYNGEIPDSDGNDSFIVLLTDHTEAMQDSNEEYVYSFKSNETKKEKKTILPLLDANFFSKRNSNDQNNSAEILKGTISTVYSSLAKFSILLMMVVLLYIGIRIIVSTTSESQAKYKELLMGWFIGLCLIFFMHVIMSFISQFNEMIVNTLGSSKVDEKYYITVSDMSSNGWIKLLEKSDNKTKYFIARKLDYKVLDSGSFEKFEISNGETTTKKWVEEGKDSSTVEVNARLYKKDADYILYKCNIIEYMRTCISFDSNYVEELKHQSDGSVKINTDASSSDEEDENDEKNMGTVFFGYAVLYIMLVIETVTFVVKYLKRVIYLAFLTMIAPLIALMYPMDKVGDGKAQTFNMWFKEYLFNSLLQPLHLLLYTIFIIGAEDLVHSHCIYAIGFYAFMLFAEGFFKKMFGFNNANVPKGLGGKLLDMKLVEAVTGLGPPGSPGNKNNDKSGINGGKFTRAKYKPTSTGGTNGNGMPFSFGGSGTGGTDGSGMPFSFGGSGTGGTDGSGMPFSSGSSSTRGTGRSGTSFSFGDSSFARTGKNSRIGNGLGIARHILADPVSRFTRRITGGATSNLGTALKGHKKEMAVNMAVGAGKRIGRRAIKVGNRIVGAGIGAATGLTAGVIGMAVTGDGNVLGNTLKTGIMAGANRAGGIEKFVGKKVEEAKMGYASENYMYAAFKNREEFIEKNSNWLNSKDKDTQNQLLETLDMASLMTDIDIDKPKKLEALNMEYQTSGKTESDMYEIVNNFKYAESMDLSDDAKRSALENRLISAEASKIPDSQISSQEVADIKSELMTNALDKKNELIKAANGDLDQIKAVNDDFNKTMKQINDPTYVMNQAKRNAARKTVDTQMNSIMNMYDKINS